MDSIDRVLIVITLTALFAGQFIHGEEINELKEHIVVLEQGKK